MARFERRPAEPQGPLPVAPYDRWPDANDNDALLFHRTPEGFILRFPGRADFSIATETGEVTCTPVPGASEQAIIALYFNQVVPLMLNHAGKLVLHAGAVNVAGQALAFAGPSGRGKSTLTAAFATAGYPFLTDDGLVLEPIETRYLANPSHASVRLWVDSESAIFDRHLSESVDDNAEKTRLISGPELPHQQEPVPLRAVYFLGNGGCDRIQFKALAPRPALTCLIQHAFVLDVDDRTRVRAHFGRLAELAESIPLFTLDYPRKYAGLRGLIDTIIQHARRGVPSS